MHRVHFYMFTWLMSIVLSSCVVRKETFESLANFRNERKLSAINSIGFLHKKIVNSWPEEEFKRFKTLPEDDQVKYLVYRLSKETSIDGERAFLLLRLVSTFNRGDQCRLRKQITSLPHAGLVRLCLRFGGSENRLYVNLTECEKLGGLSGN